MAIIEGIVTAVRQMDTSITNHELSEREIAVWLLNLHLAGTEERHESLVPKLQHERHLPIVPHFVW